MFENAIFTIRCNKCGNDIKKSLGELQADNHLVCACGRHIEVETSLIQQQIIDLRQKAVDAVRAGFAPLKR